MKLFIILAFASIFFLMPVQLFACTIFYVTDNNGHILVGRNFDSGKEAGGKIWFIPGDDNNNGIAILERLGTSMPYEGINDKGLFVGISAVPNTRTPFSFLKPMRKSLEMVKVVLEQSQTVDEALRIFSKYTVVFGTFLGHPVIHYMIVDKNGNSAIVEYVNRKMIVIKDAHRSQIMTNHFVSYPELGSNNRTSFARYNTVKDKIERIHSVEEVQSLLKEVSQNTTVWSNVYDLNNQIIYVSYKNSQTIIFSLKDEFYGGRHGYKLNNLNRLKYKAPTGKIIFRPHFGYGYIGENHISHYGVRILLPVSDNKKYGIEVTKFDKFFTIGIVLEQRLFEWFNMSIGAVGYFNYGVNNSNIIGLTLNLGWEPDNHIPFKPFVTYRSDAIFENNIEVINSISIGFNIEF